MSRAGWREMVSNYSSAAAADTFDLDVQEFVTII
jgi:hypothetical protein